MGQDHLRMLFDEAVRANPAGQPGVTVEGVAGVVRLIGLFNYVSFWRLNAHDVRSTVAAQAAEFRPLGETLLWRVYDYDAPSELPECLAGEGFKPGEPSTLMVFDLAGRLSGTEVAGADVRRVATIDALDGFLDVAAEAFGDDERWRRAAYAGRLTDPDLALFVAHLDGKAAGSARLETSVGCPFGQLFGGGVAPASRKRGLYRAMVAARVEAARGRGLAYLSTEAREMSRPVLEGLGFVPLAQATKWVLSA